MIDLNSSSQLSDRINSLIDKAMVKKNKEEKPRNYLGGSRLGVDCERALQFEFFNAPKDEGKDFAGRTLRIFKRGFWVEDMMIGWLQMAGFDLKTADRNGDQFGFETLVGKIKGHCDGVFIDGPDDYKYPALWENKGLGEKGWKKLVKEKLKKAHPTYYGQVQVYQKHFQLTDNPALFSAVNMNTMEIYWELIEHNPQHADSLDAKGKRIIQACEAGELLPRMSQDPSFYKCKWCSYTERCHGIKA